MNLAARRPLVAVAALTTVGALASAPAAIAPPKLPSANISITHVSTQTVQLTDAWSTLATDTVESVSILAALALGVNGTNPLPSPTIPLAPIVTQIVLNQLIYIGQVFNGQAGAIPAEIATHLANVGMVLTTDLPLLPSFIVAQLQTPFVAVQKAVNSVATSSNPLTGLLEAPAVFLDFALNSQTGLLAKYGPIGVPLIIRNQLAVALDPPLPAWLAHLLQPAKTPSAAARPASKAPSASAHKAPAAKATHHNSGTGHSKRG